VVVDRETLRLRIGQLLEALGRRPVEIASVRRGDVARDAGLPPAEVVGRRDVGQEREALLVAQVGAGLEEPRRPDDERGLTVRLPALDEPRDLQLATPRIS
jgi:hypothetical protein